jgi:hypothetical protein
VPLLARAREAGVACVVATQGLADLERVDRTLPQQVVQNTAVRVLLRQGSADDARAWARHAGEHEREELTRQLDYGLLLGGPETARASVRWQRDFNVQPDELQVLRTGDAVVDLTAIVGQRRVIERVRIARPRDAAESVWTENGNAVWAAASDHAPPARPRPDQLRLVDQPPAPRSRSGKPAPRGGRKGSRSNPRHAAASFEPELGKNGHGPEPGKNGHQRDGAP